MRSLVEWETYLRSYFQRRLRLIGEIHLRRRDVEELADLISAHFAEITQQEGMSHATESLKNKYAHVFVTFLTAFATFNEERNYWRTLSERLNVHEGHINNYRWRHIAYDFIESKHLPVLSENQVSNKYVATLYFHGGIPLYSLPDFFAHILLPSVQKPEYAELPSEQVLKKILAGIYNVDSAVINFLIYSGGLGEAFFASCRVMARRYLNDQEMITPEELELPTYLVEAFFRFMETSQEQPFHLRKPFLTFNPYDDPCLRLNLPEEQIPLYFVEEKIYWQISWDKQQTPIEVAPTLRKQRQDVLIRESSLAIHNTPASLKVSLFRRREGDSPQPIRRWTLPCFPSKDQPLFSIRDTGQILASEQELPGESLLLVFPADVQLQTDGEGIRLETYPSLGGVFSDWKAEAWDLTHAQSLHLLRFGQEICPAIPIGFDDQAPMLTGAICQYNDDPNDISLFTSHAPILRIPKRPGRSLQDELKRWKLEIRSHWETSPTLNLEVTPTAYLDYVNVSDENFADFDLTSILGTGAAGTFNLRVHSQYETEAEFRFRVWPSLYVLGLQKIILPTEHGSEPVSFNLRLPEGTYCEIQPGVDGLSIEASTVATRIIADANCIRADLFLVKPIEGNNPVRIPVFIPVPRLQWKLLIGNEVAEEPEWASLPISKAIDSLVQASSASIHLSIHGIREIADRVSLLLVDSNLAGDHIQEEKIRINTIEKDVLRLPLNPFRTTLAGYKQSPQLELQLFYQAPNFEESKRVPLVFLSRQLEIKDVSFSKIGELTWLLSWSETSPLRNRRVLIRSVWQPWQSAWEFQIPDKARGNFVLENIGLLPSHYQVSFYTAPTGAPPRNSFPESHIFEIFTSSPEERILQLELQTCPTLEQDFRRHFEISCLLAEIGKTFDQHVNQCLEILKLRKITNLNLLFSYHTWLKNQSLTYPDNIGLKLNIRAVHYWMYAPEIVQHVLRHEKRFSPLRAAYVDLVTSSRNMYPETARLLIQYEDDPAMISYCLNFLVENDISHAVPLIMDLIHTARLSNRDAAYILASKWPAALDSLLQVPETSFRNSLITTLLHHITEPFQAVDRLPSELIQQLLNSDANDDFHRHYTRILHKRKEIASFDTETKPDNMQARPPSPQRVNLSLVVEAGRLLTPVGVGLVIALKNSSGEKIAHAHIRDANFIAILKLATGEKIILDFEKNLINFQTNSQVYACSHCNHYATTNKNMLLDHQNEEHSSVKPSVRILPSEFTIDPRDIMVLPPK